MRPFRRRAKRKGTPATMPGHAWQVGWPVTTLSPAVWDDCLPEASRAIVTLAFVSLYQRPIASRQDLATSVTVAFDIRIDMGTWAEVGVYEIEGRCRSRFCRSLTIDRPADAAGKPWGIRVRRVTPDTDPTRHNKFYLDCIRQEGADGRFLSPPEGEAA